MRPSARGRKVWKDPRDSWQRPSRAPFPGWEGGSVLSEVGTLRSASRGGGAGAGRRERAEATVRGAAAACVPARRSWRPRGRERCPSSRPPPPHPGLETLLPTRAWRLAEQVRSPGPGQGVGWGDKG